MAIKSDGDLIRRQNRALILRTLRRHSPLARIELGELTQLSPATITAITADLIDEGLVRVGETPEDGARPPSPPMRSARGRPRVALALEPGAACVLGIKIVIEQVEFILADFSGRIVAQSARKFAYRTMPPEEFVARLETMVRDFLASAGRRPKDLTEISIASHGFIDTLQGRVVWSPGFLARNIDITAPLTEALGVPCTIVNDANMIARALNATQPERYNGTFAVVFVDYGVGMGLMADNRLYVGAHGAAAEFGHMNHIPYGALCRCGRCGCVEAYTANYAIYRMAKGLPDDAVPAAEDLDPCELARIEASAHAGDSHLRSVYHQAGIALGFGLARMIALIDPSEIFFTGASIGSFSLMEAGIQEGLREALIEDLSKPIRFTPLPADQDMTAVGLITTALTRLDREVFARPPARPEKRLVDAEK